MPAPPSEVLVILGAGRQAADRTDLEVVHAASPRVFVVTARSPLPDDVSYIGRTPPDDVLAELDIGERLFVDGWVARQASRDEPRPGDGASWDAPGFEPPGPPR